MKFAKKIFLIWTIAALIGLSLPFAPKIIPKAKASVPTFETNVQVIVSEIATAGSTWGELGQTIMEWLERFVRSGLRKALLDMIIDQIVQWVQGGGEPKIVTDWRGLLENAGQEALDGFLNNLGSCQIDSSFKIPLINSIAAGGGMGQRRTETSKTSNLCQMIEPTFSTEEKANFMTDFRNGGFDALIKMWEPQNNFYGLNWTTHLLALLETSEAISAAKNEALAGGGFLSVKECEKDADGKDIPATCKITTPGTTVAATIAKAVGADIDYIINVEELEDLIAAVADAFINRVIFSAEKGLMGLTTPSASKDGRLTNRVQQSYQDYQAASEDRLSLSKSNILEQVNRALSPRREAENYMKQSIDLQISLISKLNELLACYQTLEGTFAGGTPESIRVEISREQAILSSIQDRFNESRRITQSLETAEIQIGNLNQNDKTELIKIYNRIAPELNPIAALNFSSASQAERDSIQQKLNSSRERLSQCQQQRLRQQQQGSRF